MLRSTDSCIHVNPLEQKSPNHGSQTSFLHNHVITSLFSRGDDGVNFYNTILTERHIIAIFNRREFVIDLQIDQKRISANVCKKFPHPLPQRYGRKPMPLQIDNLAIAPPINSLKPPLPFWCEPELTFWLSTLYTSMHGTQCRKFGHLCFRLESDHCVAISKQSMSENVKWCLVVKYQLIVSLCKQIRMQ